MARKKIVRSEWRDYLHLIAPAGDFTQWQFVDHVLENSSQDIRLDQTTVSNWRRGEYVPPRSLVVAAVAEAFGREPLEALVAAGHIDINWVTKSLSRDALKTLAQIGITPGD